MELEGQLKRDGIVEIRAEFCTKCTRMIAHDEERYDCNMSGEMWHENCYEYQPGDEDIPVKYFPHQDYGN